MSLASPRDHVHPITLKKHVALPASNLDAAGGPFPTVKGTAADGAERLGFLDGQGGRPSRRGFVGADLAAAYDRGFRSGRRSARLGERNMNDSIGGDPGSLSA